MKNLSVFFVVLVTSGSAWATSIPSSIILKTPGFPFTTANVNLYASGHWTGSIQVPPGASAETLANATLLQGYLQRIGGPINVLTTTSGTGVKVGTFQEWLPYLGAGGDYAVGNTNDYVLITRGGTLRINAKDQLSLERAIFRYLELLGYRQFFPTALWEDLPTPRAFTANLGIQEKRLFNSEKMIGGSGFDIDSTMALIDSWRQKNRITSDAKITDFQMWQNQIIGYYDDIFVEGSPYMTDQGYKLCVMEPRVRDLVLERVKKQFDSQPDLLAWSVNATDGSLGWDEPCDNGGPVESGGTGENFMTPTDRQVSLANYVQENLVGIGPTGVDYSTKKIAFQAYGDTSPKPTIYLNPKILVTVATAFIQGGRTPEQVAEDYRSMVELGGVLDIGYYGYLGTQLWGHGNPTAARMSQQTKWDDLYNQIMEVTRTSNFKYTSGESSSAWGLYGLGFYSFARLLSPDSTASTDVNVRLSAIKNDFLTRALGPAAEPMRGFIDLVTAQDGRQKLLTEDLLHRMYDFLQQARNAINLNTDTVFRDRISDIVLYARSQDLWRLATREPVGTTKKLDAYDALSKHVYRIRSTLMYDYYNFFFDPKFKSLKDDMEARYAAEGLKGFSPDGLINAALPSWNAAPFTDSEIQAIVTQGLVSNKLFPFTPIYYPMDDLDITTAFDNDPRDRIESTQDSFKALYGDHDWYLKTKPGQTVFSITAKAGAIVGVVNALGPATVSLYKLGLDGGAEEFVDSVSVIADNLTEVVKDFAVKENTLYIMWVTDPAVIVRLKWNKDLNKISHEAVEGNQFSLGSSVWYYFYVPKGTTEIGAYFGRTGCKVVPPDGSALKSYTYTGPGGEAVSIPVVDQADTGKIWKIYILASASGIQGTYLLNVPAQMARSPKELLIQKSLIVKDGL